MASDDSTFGLTKEQLNKLAQLRGRNSKRIHLPPYDGIKGVLRKLNVPSAEYGLDALNKNDLEERRSIFGENLWSGTQRDRQATVLRNGKSEKIPIVEVVVGDICLLKIGDQAPADGMLIESNGLKMDESSLTGTRVSIGIQCHNLLVLGEDTLVNKPNEDIILGGTQVASGEGKIVVIGVGINSQAGQPYTVIGYDSDEFE